MKIRTGIGYDVHRLVEGLDLWIGGIRIEHTKGFVAHSDGDILIHAICDALLGAAGLRDIGCYFPDTSAEFKGIDSKILLKRVVDLLNEKSFRIGNVDSVIAMQKPKLKPHIEEMKSVLAPIMGIEIEDLSIKASTTEQLGFEGREEGVTAYASVLIYRD